MGCGLAGNRERRFVAEIGENQISHLLVEVKGLAILQSGESLLGRCESLEDIGLHGWCHRDCGSGQPFDCFDICYRVVAIFQVHGFSPSSSKLNASGAPTRRRRNSSVSSRLAKVQRRPLWMCRTSLCQLPSQPSCPSSARAVCFSNCSARNAINVGQSRK